MTGYLGSKEALAGFATIAIGAGVVHVTMDYGIGTPRQMGPGFFPVLLGGLMCLVGVLILIGAAREREALPAPPWRALFVMPFAIVAFAVVLPKTGLGPAGVATVLIAGLAQARRPTVGLAGSGTRPRPGGLAALRLAARRAGAVHRMDPLMTLIDSLQLGFVTAMSLENLFYCFVGVSVGMIVGVLPGIGHLAAISLLMPLTFHVPATAALVMLAGIYYGAQYGGSIASMLLNLPGTASSAVICLDGYPMAQKGRAGSALMITTIASFFGSCVAIVVLIFLAPPLARVAMNFHSADYFSMMVLGLVAAGSIGQGKPTMGFASMLLGLIVGLVGIDVNSGTMRMTFGSPELMDGISIIVIAMALFGVTEVISSVGSGAGAGGGNSVVSWRSLMPTRDEWR